MVGNNTLQTFQANTGAFPGLSLEKTNQIKEKSKLMSTNSYDQMLIQDDMYKQELNKQKHETFVQQRQMGRMGLEEQVQNANDPKTKNTKTSIKNIAALADMYRQYGYEHGKNWDSMQDEELISRFNTKNPQVKKLADDFLTGGEGSEYKLSQQLGISGSLVETRAKEKMKNGFWDQTWSNMRAMANVPIDSMKKWGQRTMNELGAEVYKKVIKNVVGDVIDGETVDDVFDKTLDKVVKSEILDYQNEIDARQLANIEKNVDKDVREYYGGKGYTKLLKEGDRKGFIYKSLGDASQNWEMPVVIAASVFQPEVGFALMATDTYARENQEAFENMLNNGADYEQAEQGAVVVGLVNAAVEVGLEKMLGGVETKASDAIRKTFMKNVQDEAAKKGLGRIIAEGVGTQLYASAEEGLEEIVQQIVQNAAVKTVNENQDLFQGIGQAFEGGFYNPMNLLAGGGNLTQNLSANKEAIRQSILNRSSDTNTDTSSTESQGILDKVTDYGAELITNTVSAQDKLYKAQEPRMNKLTSKKNLEKRRANSDRANQLIIENGYVPTNTAERLDAHKATLDKLWKQIKSQIDKQGGKKVDQKSMVDALENYIKEKKALNIAAIEPDIKALEKELKMIKSSQKRFGTDLPTLENRKQVYNDLVDREGQEASEVLKGGYRLLSAEIGKIEDAILAEVPGEFAKQKKDVGALLDTYEDVFKADMKNQRNKGVGLTEAYSRIEGISDIVNGFIGVVTGKGSLESIAKGGAKLLVGKSLAKAKDVDFLVNQGFKALAEELKSKKAENGRVMNNEVDESNPVKEMTPEEEYQEKVNRIMTPKEVETIVNMAWAANNLRDFYDGEYKSALDWLKGVGSDQVEMYAENTLATQRMIESHPELLDGETTFSEVLDAYLDGTLTGKPKEAAERLDLSQDKEYTPTKFYEPQQMRNAQEVWDEANKRVTNANRQEVYQARGEFVIDAHNPQFVKELGLTDAEVNKKLMSWAAYPAKAKELSNKINDGVTASYRWAGLENSSIVKSIAVSDADLEKMVKSVEGNSQEYERKYISNTMLALDTHIDRSPLTFNFVRGGTLNHTDSYNRHHEVLGNYNEQTNTINIATAGQNTVAHEMGHYLDYLRGRQLFGKNVTLSEGGGRNLDTLTPDQQKFVKNFDSFMLGLKTAADTWNEYTITPTEVFARFVARFTEWTRKTATNDRYSYETKWYNDKFVDSDYVEFAKILQEKSKLDLANEYANYEEYIGRNEQWKGKAEIRELTMTDAEMRKWQKKGLKKIGDGKYGPLYVGLKDAQAVSFLLGTQNGEVQGAFNMGGEPVNLVWEGNGEYIGVRKLVEKHPEVLYQIQKMIDDRLNSNKNHTEKEGKYVLEDDDGKVVIKLQRDEEDKNMLITAYKFKP